MICVVSGLSICKIWASARKFRQKSPIHDHSDVISGATPVKVWSESTSISILCVCEQQGL